MPLTVPPSARARFPRSLAFILLLATGLAAGCGPRPATDGEASSRAPAAALDTAATLNVPRESAGAAPGGAHAAGAGERGSELSDTPTGAPDSTTKSKAGSGRGGTGGSRPDSTRGSTRASRPDSAHDKTSGSAPDSARRAGADPPVRESWSVRGPAPMAGAILPATRIVAYYGNPLSKRMGILGALPPEQMLGRLAEQIRAWERADPATPVRGALQLIVTVAQAAPGPSGLYRLRMADTLIQRVAGWAAQQNYLLILDVQVGQGTVKAELQPLLKYLALPNVHLALDPEFSMKGGRRPGRVIGTMNAADVNVAVDTLAALVTRYGLPPKVLIVHRFTGPMLTGEQQIRLDPRVQVVVDMDGFGSQRLKRGSYRAYIHDRPVQYPGIKIFYRQDTDPMTPADVLRLDPVPVYVMYQ